MKKSALKKLVAKNMTKTVLDIIGALASEQRESDISNLIAITEARYNNLITRSLAGIVNDQDEKAEINKINLTILGVIDQLMDDDTNIELPTSREQVFEYNSSQFIDIFPRQDDICDCEFYRKINYYLLKAESSIYITGGGLSQACDSKIMEEYLFPYRTLLDKREGNKLYRLQYHDNLIYKNSKGIWQKSRWSNHLGQFIKEYEQHQGLNIYVDKKKDYPLHCFVIDYLKENCIVEFFLPSTEGNGGNAIFLHGHLENKTHIARDLAGALYKQMSKMQKISTKDEFEKYVNNLLETKNKAFRSPSK